MRLTTFLTLSPRETRAPWSWRCQGRSLARLTVRRKWISLMATVCLCCLLSLSTWRRIVQVGMRSWDVKLPESYSFPLNLSNTTAESNLMNPRRDAALSKKFHVLWFPELTTWLVGNYSEQALEFYEHSLSEQQAEVWLHRGFTALAAAEWEGDPVPAADADLILIPAYLHFNSYLVELREKGSLQSTDDQLLLPLNKTNAVRALQSRLSSIDYVNKPVVFMVPTWNPEVSRVIGVRHMVQMLKSNMAAEDDGVGRKSFPRLYSLGFERNSWWQRVPPHRIIPIPYVVKPTLSREELQTALVTSPQPRLQKIFYVGDARPHAWEWAGCNRSMVLPLQNRTDMTVRLVSPQDRLTAQQYHQGMLTSQYCLIVCGDTPTSRTLASAMLHGCLPLFIGSRWRGLCTPPCRPGWGWTVLNPGPNSSSFVPGSEGLWNGAVSPRQDQVNESELEGLSHWPFREQFDWRQFPELDEAIFARDPNLVLDQFFSASSQPHKPLSYSSSTEEQGRSLLKEWQEAWVYGWGNPVDATAALGDTYLYIWTSIVETIWPPSSYLSATN